MKEIKIKSYQLPNIDDGDRTIFIPSGFRDKWLMIVETNDYKVYIGYLSDEEVEYFNLPKQ